MMSMRTFSRYFNSQTRKILSGYVRRGIKNDLMGICTVSLKSAWHKPLQYKIMNFANKFRPNTLIASFGLLGMFKFTNDDEEEEPEFIMTIKRSIFLIQKEEYKKAEQMLHVALNQAQSVQNYKGITYIYHVMADLASQVGEIEKAKNLYKSVMQRMISSGIPQDDLQIIHTSLKVAKLHEQSEDMSIAETGYKFCIENAEEHARVNPDDEYTMILWATAADWYARMLMNVSRHKEALKNFLQAHDICVKLYGDNHQWTVVLLNDMGMACCLLGQYDSALEYIKRAIKIGKNLDKESDLSEMYINLGYIYMQKSLYKEATKACTEGLKRAKNAGKEDCAEEAYNCLNELKGKL